MNIFKRFEWHKAGDGVKDDDAGASVISPLIGGAGGAGGEGFAYTYNGREDGIAKGYLCPDEDCPICVHGMGGAHPTSESGRLIHFHQFAASQGIEESDA